MTPDAPNNQTPAAETIESSGNAASIVTTNRLFVKVPQRGMCDKNGRAVFAADFGTGKRVAEPERPIATLILPLIHQILGYAKYSTQEAADKDLALLREYAASLNFSKKG